MVIGSRGEDSKLSKPGRTAGEVLAQAGQPEEWLAPCYPLIRRL